MADKTTTLKTKTNDNVYPNVIGDNRDNAIVNSAHIKHTLTKDHKINFRLDDNVSNLIFNSLQKPAGLTKTKLVGVGTNGQENIEIGDNLTLANGKLSATVGGSGGDSFDTIVLNDDFETYTGTITGTKPIILKTGEGNLVSSQYVISEGIEAYFTQVYLFEEEAQLLQIKASGGKIAIKEFLINKYYNHFITLTNNNDRIYFQCVTGNDEPLNTEALKNFLFRKKLICTGVLGNSAETLATPLFVTGENEELRVYYVLKNDTSGTISSKSVTSFASSDSIAEIG